MDHFCNIGGLINHKFEDAWGSLEQAADDIRPQASIVVARFPVCSNWVGICQFWADGDQVAKEFEVHGSGGFDGDAFPEVSAVFDQGRQ